MHIFEDMKVRISTHKYPIAYYLLQKHAYFSMHVHAEILPYTIYGSSQNTHTKEHLMTQIIFIEYSLTLALDLAVGL